MCSWGKVLIKRCKKMRNSIATSNEPRAKTGYEEQKQGTVHVHCTPHHKRSGQNTSVTQRPDPLTQPYHSVQFSSVQSLSHVQLFVTPWIAPRQASLSITNSRSSLKLTSTERVMPSSHLILCLPLFLLPPIPPSIRVFSNESTLHMTWPEY